MVEWISEHHSANEECTPRMPIVIIPLPSLFLKIEISPFCQRIHYCLGKGTDTDYHKNSNMDLYLLDNGNGTLLVVQLRMIELWKTNTPHTLINEALIESIKGSVEKIVVNVRKKKIECLPNKNVSLLCS